MKKRIFFTGVLTPVNFSFIMSSIEGDKYEK